jgi:hypothetical protein
MYVVIIKVSSGDLLVLQKGCDFFVEPVTYDALGRGQTQVAVARVRRGEIKSYLYTIVI